ncbi:hypothetical protein Acsp04_66990 [Actinomadura sp. NBRC 104425]|uniref:hypothetical protein n=1 Tax=Actinomadura sp. NBRC 104425 TaxID=3032204 RepID=UPI0024A33BE1|nr:hypothetical protein [Actinomadura sp. NBRC 104425]GLZ16464.1 hypothetical protein Acsp04_66990 [Actinomadura sp. NBRC 104425]
MMKRLAAAGIASAALGGLLMTAPAAMASPIAVSATAGWYERHDPDHDRKHHGKWDGFWDHHKKRHWNGFKKKPWDDYRDHHKKFHKEDPRDEHKNKEEHKEHHKDGHDHKWGD